jgi:hypothetical protein
MNELTISDERLERVRRICLAFPEAREKEAWGDPTWRVRDKIFVMQKGNYHAARPSLWMKAPEGMQGVLVEAAPERFFVPPYVGKNGWIGLWMDTDAVDWEELTALARDSYRLTAPKKLAALVLSPSPPP